MRVKVWSEEVIIPTYEVGVPEKNPMFLEKRVYQGSTGVVYPYPVIEKIEDKPHDKKYNALWLENKYIKIMVLPELGGRVQMAYDKIKQRHFIYYNNVIKPALVGLAGPWISGGIEFNWPQHHRPSTFMPVDYTIERLEDGGATVWVSERERMFHQRGAAGFTLRPDRAVLEIRGRVYNPTPIPQTFLWWANPAVAVNDHYQSVFPADVNAVYDHGKRDVSTFPIATGTYYKMDYSKGVDISKYKNIPVPTSYMAVASKYNFVGGYENDTCSGLLHVANHHISPGKKQWTWGNCDFGVAWDRNLTDNDGPYIELMTGVYTDNQPDFTWLQPYEEKTFTQYFLPYRELGVVKNASADLLLNLEVENGVATVKIFATSPQESLNVELKSGSQTYYNEIHAISPEEVFVKNIETEGCCVEDLIVTISSNGRELLSWRSEAISEEIPEPAKAALDIDEIESNEELFLTGQHLEQYRHATYDPTLYYKEAIRRDKYDIRNNNALGLWLLRHGKFEEAEGYLRSAVKRQMERNPNPYDGEPLYNLGLTLKFQGRLEEAYSYFYKSCWNSAWQDSGYFSLAQISSMSHNWESALSEINNSLNRNYTNILARHLKSVILRKANKIDAAQKFIDESLELDKFNSGSLFERYINSGASSDKASFIEIMRCESHNYEELALDYLNAGLYEECIGVLGVAVEVCCSVSPMVYYYMAHAYALSGDLERAREMYDRASSCDPTYCFPNRLEAIVVLQAAIAYNASDAKALYYLGNLWYDKRQYDESVLCWESSINIDPNYPTVKRNLALAYFNKLNRSEEAVELLEGAFALDISDTRILMELDQLYKKMHYSHQARLSVLDKYLPQIEERDDLYLEYVTLLNSVCCYERAKSMVDSRKFHPWEGGEGRVATQYQICRTELAKIAISECRYEDAIQLLAECQLYPHNLGEGKLQGAQENDFNYWLARAYDGLSSGEVARRHYKLASEGLSEPCDVLYYNDQKPDKIFYQGLALLKLGDIQEAERRFKRLISYGEDNIDQGVKIDYFAVSLPDLLIWEDDLNIRKRTHCNYMMGLGYLGLGDVENAKKYLKLVVSLDNNNQGAAIHLNMI